MAVRESLTAMLIFFKHDLFGLSTLHLFATIR
jgi:hypothetical protein